ncbi:hypothetical protein OHAE_3437 [Ochrobactrum soli]|uniref:Uncharacterized protein n=1 Tax=Ochrobactrum soli TaxID=2448455 RepID=A0A2P9HHC5_9HYPH|nr:hypothetical protein OHAE_3437 [[Ochrobactrum] soli]
METAGGLYPIFVSNGQCHDHARYAKARRVCQLMRRAK